MLVNETTISYSLVLVDATTISYCTEDDLSSCRYQSSAANSQEKRISCEVDDTHCSSRLYSKFMPLGFFFGQEVAFDMPYRKGA